MPRLTRSVPQYRRHKASGRAVVTLNGKDFYLGLYGSPESRETYDRLIAEFLAHHRFHPQVDALSSSAASTTGLTINEVFLRYWKHVEGYYVKQGQPTSEQGLFKLAARPLLALYGSTPAAAFCPASLMTYRQQLVERGLSRGVVNQHVSRVKRMFKWAGREGLAPPIVFYNLACVDGLRAGRSKAREPEPVRPVAEDRIDAVIRIAPPHIEAMIQLQKLSGMRPGEVTLMRACDLDTSGRVWVYRPSRHKTEHRNRPRLIHLGPSAQGVLQPFLRADLQAYLFSPSAASIERNRTRRRFRKSPMTPSQAARQPKRDPAWRPGNRYTTPSYRQAIHRLCDRAFPCPASLDPSQRTAWQNEYRWDPNQLRHNAATFLRKQFGIDAARAILGHSSPVVTEIYAEIDQAKASQVMGEVG